MATVQNTFTGYPVSYDEDTAEWYSTAQNASNAYDSADSSNYFQIYLTRGSGAETYCAFNFDTSSIPDNATIISVTCTAKCYCSNTQSNRISTRDIQLYSGNTAKGSAYTISSSTSAFSITAGTWTRSELDNAKIVLHCVRGSNSTTSNYYLRFYGATLTVKYEYSNVTYTITSSSTATNVASIDPSGETEVGEGGDYILTINATSLNNIQVLDNNIDVTSLLVLHTMGSGGTISKTAESQTNSGILSGSSYASYAVGNTAEDPYSSTSNMYGSSSSLGYVNYSFDFSEIPTNATITSVEVKVYGHRESSTTDSTHVAKIQLYSGSNIKGDDLEFTSTSNQLITLSNPGTWTREELLDAILRFSVGYYGGLVLGITWKVTYDIPSSFPYYWTYTIDPVNGNHTIIVRNSGEIIEDTIYIKVNNSWKLASRVYAKINGTWKLVNRAFTKTNNSWILESDKSKIFNANAIYINGGNI